MSSQRIIPKLSIQQRKYFEAILRKLNLSDLESFSSSAVAPFLRTSQMTNSELKECWAISCSRSNSLTREEFFNYLCCVSVVQSRLPLNQANIERSHTLPLPQFTNFDHQVSELEPTPQPLNPNPSTPQPLATHPPTPQHLNTSTPLEQFQAALPKLEEVARQWAGGRLLPRLEASDAKAFFGHSLADRATLSSLWRLLARGRNFLLIGDILYSIHIIITKSPVPVLIDPSILAFLERFPSRPENPTPPTPQPLTAQPLNPSTPQPLNTSTPQPPVLSIPVPLEKEKDPHSSELSEFSKQLESLGSQISESFSPLEEIQRRLDCIASETPELLQIAQKAQTLLSSNVRRRQDISKYIVELSQLASNEETTLEEEHAEFESACLKIRKILADLETQPSDLDTQKEKEFVEAEFNDHSNPFDN